MADEPPPPTKSAFGTRTERSGPGGVSRSFFPPAALEWALWRFGEDDLLLRVRAGLDEEALESIGIRHATLIAQVDPDSRSGAGLADDKALALAAVEVMDGGMRSLARRRRRSMPA